MRQISYFAFPMFKKSYQLCYNLYTSLPTAKALFFHSPNSPNFVAFLQVFCYYIYVIAKSGAYLKSYKQLNRAYY